MKTFSEAYDEAHPVNDLTEKNTRMAIKAMAEEGWRLHQVNANQLVWVEDSGHDYAALYVNGDRRWIGHASSFEMFLLVGLSPIGSFEVRDQECELTAPRGEEFPVNVTDLQPAKVRVQQVPTRRECR